MSIVFWDRAPSRRARWTARCSSPLSLMETYYSHYYGTTTLHLTTRQRRPWAYGKAALGHECLDRLDCLLRLGATCTHAGSTRLIRLVHASPSRTLSVQHKTTCSLHMLWYTTSTRSRTDLYTKVSRWHHLTSVVH